MNLWRWSHRIAPGDEYEVAVSLLKQENLNPLLILPKPLTLIPSGPPARSTLQVFDSGAATAESESDIGKMCILYFFTILLLSTPLTSSLWIPFSSSTATTSDSLPSRGTNERAEFSIQSFQSEEGQKLIEDARMKQLSLNTCWQEAYRNLFSSCSEIISNEEKHKRLAWQLSDCFVKDSGNSGLPACGLKSAMKDCRRKLQDFQNDIYLQFFIQTNAICHQLQADAFKRDTERLINGLKSSAQTAEEKLEGLEGRTDQLLQSSNQIHSSLTSVHSKTQVLAQRSSDFETQINNVFRHSEVILERTKGIAASQSELQEGQAKMKERVEVGMSVLHNSYESLSDGMDVLKKETSQIEEEVNHVGNLMSAKMNNLQVTADDIGQIAGMSLDKQKKLLSGQVRALEELEFLTKFQSQALEESRETLHKLGEFSREQQDELLRRQELIQRAHDRLIQNSQSILSAQETFEAKQANIFAALDKLFTIHNAILVESRFIKSFFFYCFMISLCYILTSAKQTFSLRAYLYLGICLTFIVEIAIVRSVEGGDLQRQSLVASRVFLARTAFLVASSLQILYAIYTYRDYEVLNYRMLKELQEKINVMELKRAELPSFSSEEREIDRYDWIDKDLPEVNSCEDPDYLFPEEVAENSLTFSNSKSYNLRPRNRRFRD